MLKPLNITQGGNRSEGGPDIIPLADRGVPVVLFEQDASTYFDVHHTANDTLDKVDRSDLNHNVSAFAVFAYLAANHESDFGRQLLPKPDSSISSAIDEYLMELNREDFSE